MGLELRDAAHFGLFGKPFFERLLESLDFSLGLWMEGSAVLLCDSELSEFVFEFVVTAPRAGSEDKAVVGQCRSGRPVFVNGVEEGRQGDVPVDHGVSSDGKCESGVII